MLAEYELDRLHQAPVFAPVIDKRYGYDASDNLTEKTVNYGQGDRPFHFGARETEQYHYDAVGQITARVKGYDSTGYQYDAARNRFEQTSPLVVHNRVTAYGGYTCQYDGFGRMSVRTDVRKRIKQYFAYNSEHRLVSVRFENHPSFSHVAYRYDVLGRRKEKVLYRHPQENRPVPEPEVITFFWNGMEMCGECSSAKPGNSVLYTYGRFSHEPLSRTDIFHYEDPENGESHHAVEVYYYHNHLNGMPEELTDEEGSPVWRGHSGLWGETLREENRQSTVVEQNLKLQGQYLDRETGLHYNTFRYYDPAAGRFTQPDPIGLLGGLNLYAYVPNPLTWSDPLGLSPCSSNKGFNRRDRITSRWTERLTGKKPADVHDYLTSKGWSKTYPQADKPGAIQHIQYVKTTKSGTTYKLDYHPGGSGSQKNVHGNDYWKVYRDVNGKDVVYGRIGHGGFKNHDLITD